MANTKKSAKRARQALRKQNKNQIIRSLTKTAVKTALDILQSKDIAKVKTAYLAAVKALSKAASKGTIPKGQSSRKISRLTLLIKKQLPAALGQ